MANIQKMFPDHWEAFCNLRDLRNVPRDILQKELNYIHTEGVLLRNRNETARAVIEVIKALEKALPALGDAYKGICALPKSKQQEYRALVNRIPVKRKPVPLRLLEKRLRSNIRELKDARTALGITIGAKVTSSPRRWPHASPLRHMAPATGMAMRAWNRLTGKDVRSPKGLSEGGPYGVRPHQDDAYFVFLCLNIAGFTEDPRNAISSIKRVRKQLVSLSKSTPSMKQLAKNLLSAERQALRKVYGIKS